MMYVVGFDGRQHVLDYMKCYNRKFRRNKSNLHITARGLINKILPNLAYEEVTLPGTKRLGRNSLLYADFFIPSRRTIIEVHGSQHYRYNQYFFKNKMEFFQYKQRDKDKAEWCSLNGIQLLILKYSERRKWKRILEKTFLD